MSVMARIWHRAFLAERPSTSLPLFRFAVAFTVGAHMIPSLLQLQDNYLAGSFRTKNIGFFPLEILRQIETSPDWVVMIFVAAFYVTLAAFTLGCFTRVSCVLMTLSCYYFYALNDMHIGTLSFDILLVTLFLVCVTNYPGDFLSFDSLCCGDPKAYKRPRPFFLQRLLQLQLVVTFWHTALGKTHLVPKGAQLVGNWLTDNPYLALMHYPPQGVVKDFPLREWLGQHPDLCYGLGIVLIVVELTIPFLWFIPRTRLAAIAVGIMFQLMLWITLHVPTIFLFLFPPMMLLFIPPEHLVRWIEGRRARNLVGRHGVLVYDGQCGFCLESVKRLRVLDVFGWVELQDVHAVNDSGRLHPDLTAERCRSEMVLIGPDGRLTGGFDAFVRLTRRLPLLMPLAPLVHLPGAAWMGRPIYRWVAAHRYLFHRNPACTTHQCALPASGG